uniref:Uncharacterized protein n=1 Tax=Myoviridae sp. ct4QN2 TaxID=2825030 RepID=A0A8S5PVC0_9CAUD|nr:MAG TPA: hypothetical protein [Myoviridae sp. ct4QN2]DAG69529.1 MAG TPA: hypothetical protein [Caudoviricetes sp.]DAL33913.1 MAG TPA_asm: hypothetical protein [Caudoviricetes sp.]DAL74603.1 MAG TPA: hypothetical protein [Caudoviricetes sp.]
MNFIVYIKKMEKYVIIICYNNCSKDNNRKCEG